MVNGCSVVALEFMALRNLFRIADSIGQGARTKDGYRWSMGVKWDSVPDPHVGDIRVKPNGQLWKKWGGYAAQNVSEVDGIANFHNAFAVFSRRDYFGLGMN